MAARATLHQAIEMLKIHQLRRENAVIYQQITNLQNEILDLKSEQDSFRDHVRLTSASMRDCKDLVSRCHNRLNTVDEQIGPLNSSKDETTSMVRSLQDEYTMRFCEVKERFDQIERKSDQSKQRLDTLGDRNDTAHAKLVATLEGLQDQLAQKADVAALETIQSRLYAIDRSVYMGSKRLPSANTILVQHSVEEDSLAKNLPHGCAEIESARRIFNGSSGVLYDNVVQPAKNTGEGSNRQLHSCDRVSDTASADSLHLITVSLPTVVARESTTADDIDLDENAGTGKVSHFPQWTSSQSFLRMLPQPRVQSPIPPNVTSSLRQTRTESFGAYLERAESLWSGSSHVSEEVSARKLVDGLVDEQLRAFAVKLLSATSWTLQNIHELCGIYHANAPDAGSVKDQVRDATQPELTTTTGKRPHLSAKATDKAKEHTQPIEERKLRRSQRIAERSQAVANKDTHDIARHNVENAKPHKSAREKKRHEKFQYHHQRVPSPYHPEPRLVVPGNTKIDLPRNPSSVDDNALLPQAMRAHDGRFRPVNAHGMEAVMKDKVHTRTKKRKRAPLPPPPEIPILPTSTDDD